MCVFKVSIRFGNKDLCMRHAILMKHGFFLMIHVSWDDIDSRFSPQAQKIGLDVSGRNWLCMVVSGRNLVGIVRLGNIWTLSLVGFPPLVS